MTTLILAIQWRSTARWALALLLIGATVFGMLTVAHSRVPAKRTFDLVVVPHPDDEFQTWSLVENRTDSYKVFVSLTRGEESGFCEPEILTKALQENLGELEPQPTPTGRWTEECGQARERSLLGYLAQKSASDPTVPADFGALSMYGPLPARISVCRFDNDIENCDQQHRLVRVWKDVQKRGAVVFFDLGDGDLTPSEASWAIQAVLDNRDEWGLDSDAGLGSIIGAFANDSSPCFHYPHPGHLAVHSALWEIDFRAGPQIGATCFLDPRQRMSALVTTASADASFARSVDDVRLGAHGVHYGWLHGDMFPLSRMRQNTLFMRFQSFWVRFN